VTYVKNAISEADIPDIDTTKDWGSYQIKNLAVDTIKIDPANLRVSQPAGRQHRQLLCCCCCCCCLLSPASCDDAWCVAPCPTVTVAVTVTAPRPAGGR
jgi:hypothetical protein